MPSSYPEHVIVPYSFAGMTSRADRKAEGWLDEHSDEHEGHTLQVFRL
jgi:hypothetical protein